MSNSRSKFDSIVHASLAPFASFLAVGLLLAVRGGAREMGALAIATAIPSFAWVAFVGASFCLLRGAQPADWSLLRLVCNSLMFAGWVFLASQLLLRSDSGIVAPDDRLLPAQIWTRPWAVPSGFLAAVALGSIHRRSRSAE